MKVLLIIQGRRSPEQRAKALEIEKAGLMPRFSEFEAALGNDCQDLTMIAHATLNIPATKFTLVRHQVDQLFWTPNPSDSSATAPNASSDFVLSAGA